jgi:phosphatidylglycerol:prolipoprotein diacylglycerol transferase
MQWTANPRVHLAFEIAGYVAAASVYAMTRARRGDPIGERPRAIVIAAAGFGAAIGMRLLYALSFIGANPFTGKTVVGGLLGGWIGVEIAKKLNGIRQSTGDLFVMPAIVAMCIGRIGCFLTGPMDRTAGNPTALPWGIAIGDGVPRHPVALYEIAFLIALGFATRTVRRQGDQFKLFMASYLLFRLIVDFLKPEPPPIAGGLSAIQWACVAGLSYYGWVLFQRVLTRNDERSTPVPLL